MKTWVPLLLGGLLLAATSQAQTRREVYEWKDANGVTHYSDQPQPGARKIILNGAPSSSPAAPPAGSSPGSSAKPAAASQVQYQSVEILTPADETSYFEPDAEIAVRVRVEPALDSEDRLVTYLDNKQLGDVNQTEHRISGLDRGAHILQVAIYGFDGKEKIRSDKVTFHMKQPAVTNTRNVGPSLRPPPKPKPK